MLSFGNLVLPLNIILAILQGKERNFLWVPIALRELCDVNLHLQRMFQKKLSTVFEPQRTQRFATKTKLWSGIFIFVYRLYRRRELSSIEKSTKGWIYTSAYSYVSQYIEKQ